MPIVWDLRNYRASFSTSASIGEGLTRARVTQLMKLSKLPKEVRREIDEGIGEDELYSIKALIACVGQEI